MKCLIINGSPRGKNSNTTRIVRTWIFPNDEVDMLYARDLAAEEAKLLAADADGYLIITPLYVDSIPAVLKAVFETMEQHKQKYAGRKVWFIIHSGFPEPKHSRLVERYMKHFAGLLGMQCMGTAVMGNSEGLQVAPDAFYRKKRRLFATLGKNMKDGNAFNRNTVQQIAGRETLPKFLLLLISLLNTSKFMWDKQLKKHGAFEKRFDKPYA